MTQVSTTHLSPVLLSGSGVLIREPMQLTFCDKGFQEVQGSFL